jgi:hypothetical protein
MLCQALVFKPPALPAIRISGTLSKTCHVRNYAWSKPFVSLCNNVLVCCCSSMRRAFGCVSGHSALATVSCLISMYKSCCPTAIYLDIYRSTLEYALGTLPFSVDPCYQYCLQTQRTKHLPCQRNRIHTRSERRVLRRVLLDFFGSRDNCGRGSPLEAAI